MALPGLQVNVTNDDESIVPGAGLVMWPGPVAGGGGLGGGGGGVGVGEGGGVGVGEGGGVGVGGGVGIGVAVGVGVGVGGGPVEMMLWIQGICAEIRRA